MKTICYYIPNSPQLNEVLEIIKTKFISFVDREYIEMDTSEVHITARYEDLSSIENLIAPLI